MLDTLDQALEDIKVANESFEDTLVDKISDTKNHDLVN